MYNIKNTEITKIPLLMSGKCDKMDKEFRCYIKKEHYA